ncbi:restriction endonuclease subunit S [Romboutsia ilealis]|uniref:restriction endonuclease subunit S n=1 Tax=Romboutsia ilealis TaxID=1115758 RepID=UPI00257482C5|nr:restriction endonuclease subunit S [Romboutsia ilealis]
MSCNEWKEYKLGEIMDISSSKRIYAKEYISNGIPFYRGKEIIEKFKGNEVSTELFISEERFKELKEKFGIPKKGDILLTSVGTLGVPYLVQEEEFYFKDGNLTWFKNFNINCCSEFIYYWIQSSYGVNQIYSKSIGSTQKALTIDMLKKFDILLPPLKEQIEISNILSSLDNKIKLNNEMNKTLEEMAQSIFKRWFVDFEFPNEDGEPYKSSGGEMVDSEFGMIPNGWEVQCIGDIGNVITGKTPSAKVEGSYGDECNFITPRDITDSPIILNTERKLSSIGINNLKKNLVCKNSIGVSCIGSNLGEVYITGENSITNQQINTVVLDESHIYPYVYIYLKNMKNEFLNMAGGSAVPIINKTSFSGINILMPDMYILNKFVQSTTCYFERIEENLKENESLIALRDSLLPKLMSGEIDINL